MTPRVLAFILCLISMQRIYLKEKEKTTQYIDFKNSILNIQNHLNGIWLKNNYLMYLTPK